MATHGKLFDSYLARRKWLKELLDKIPKEKLTGAEIGVWKGYFILNILAVEPRIEKMYAIDINIGKKELRRFSPFKNKIVPVQGRSELVHDLVPDDLDFIHIDGDHHTLQVWQDVTLYERKLSKGRLCCGHDYYGRASREVRPIVDLYAKIHNRDLQSIAGEVNSWWWWI